MQVTFAKHKTMNINETIKLALHYYQSANLTQAEILFKEILRDQPENADILYLLGTIYAQLNKFDLSIKYTENYPSYH